jgi:hypothetical protein
MPSVASTAATAARCRPRPAIDPRKQERISEILAKGRGRKSAWRTDLVIVPNRPFSQPRFHRVDAIPEKADDFRPICRRRLDSRAARNVTAWTGYRRRPQQVG